MGSAPAARIAGRIALVERVGQQDRGPRAVLLFGRDDEGRQEQPFARAVERQDMRVRIDGGLGQAEAPPQPAACRRAPFRRAGDRRIFAELMGVGRDGLGDEAGHRPARIADGQTHGGRAGRHRIEQRRQLGESRGRKRAEAAGKERGSGHLRGAIMAWCDGFGRSLSLCRLRRPCTRPRSAYAAALTRACSPLPGTSAAASVRGPCPPPRSCRGHCAERPAPPYRTSRRHGRIGRRCARRCAACHCRSA